jgi:cell division protein FtsQ
MRRPLTLLLALLTALLIGSRFYPRLSYIDVAGASHYTAAELAALAGLSPGQPLLWITTWSLAGLVRDPWIESARVVRRWPDRVLLEVTERTPAFSYGERVYALDGTVLPGADPRAAPVTLTGWGASRLEEAAELLRLLADFQPEVLSYSPSGFTVFFADSTLYTPDVASLRAHWSGFVEHRGFSVAVYPWGVSVQP